MTTEKKATGWTPARIAQKGTEYAMFIIAIGYLNSEVSELKKSRADCEQEKTNILLQKNSSSNNTIYEPGALLIADNRRKNAWEFEETEEQ